MNLEMILSSFFSGILGSMGLGGGTILIVYLTYVDLMPQTKAQGINLVSFIPIAVLSVIVYKKKNLIETKVVRPLAFFGLLGAIIGIYILKFIPTEILGKLFGGFLILLSLKEFFLKPKTKNQDKAK